MKLRTAFLSLLILTIFSCSSPKKLYEKGNYIKAYTKVLEKLEKKKNRKDKVLLNKSFSKIIDEARAKILGLEDGYKISELERSLESYQKVEELYNKGYKYLDQENLTRYDVFDEEGNQLVRNTYVEANDLMNFYQESKNKLDARNAFYHYELVEEYGDDRVVDDFNRLDKLKEIAKYAGTVLYNVTTELNFEFSYKWDVERTFDNIEGYRGFKKVLYESNSDEIDCDIVLDFGRVDVDKDQSKTSKNYSKEITDGYTTKTDTNGVVTKIPIKKKIEGTVVTYKIVKRVTWNIDMEMHARNNNCDLRSKRFTEYVTDEIQEYEVRGDKRAIPTKFLNNNQNNRLEDTDDMVDDVIDELYDEVRSYIYN
ncbi:MAG: hypothetical protein V3V14_14625 [Saprospiraceae bacterium]